MMKQQSPDDWPVERPPFGATLHLPFEAGDPDPQDIRYADLGQPFDPDQDWRDAQVGHINRSFGEFGPEDDEDEEATDG
jgi:hypothetical protein